MFFIDIYCGMSKYVLSDNISDFISDAILTQDSFVRAKKWVQEVQRQGNFIF